MILPGTGRGTAEGGGGGLPLRRPEVYVARKLRRSMSLPEVLLWEALRSSKLGAKFRRQHPIGPYVVDFYCRTASLVIEVDGEAHERGDRPNRDAGRDRFLCENGYRVFRVAASRVLREIEAVITAISAEVAAPLHHASHGPPPRTGED
ncbi:MAG: hypothetical protein C0500_10835 [Sphingobium sp.]|nr:hypothetical protein [Sphingobium sp.]